MVSFEEPIGRTVARLRMLLGCSMRASNSARNSSGTRAPPSSSSSPVRSLLMSPLSLMNRSRSSMRRLPLRLNTALM